MSKMSVMLAVAASWLLFAAGQASADERDDDLKLKVESRLAHDPQLRNDTIEVTVEGGVVKLDGKVDNAAEKSRATRLATSAGAKRIENNLELELPPKAKENDLKARASAAAKDVGDEVSDTWITGQIKTEIAFDKGLKGSDISVDTNQNGVVTLTGTVPSEMEHQRALRLARGVTGVREVKDALTVTTQQE
jgi:hyperosmotically inducible periplasmic protein